jgi:hypothetical protein
LACDDFLLLCVLLFPSGQNAASPYSSFYP